MLQILFVTFPFFALVLCGYVGVRGRLLPVDAIPGLNSFVLYFSLPCLLYRFGASTPVAQLLDGGVFLTYGLCALLIVALVVSAATRVGLNWNDASFCALVASFPNTGFMGVPLLVALLGAAAAGPVIVTIVLDLLITSSLCIALSRWGGVGGRGSRSALAQALRSVLTNPMPWAIVLGGLASSWQLSLPKPMMQTLSLLADAASPLGLFTIGAVLARSQLQRVAAKETVAARVPGSGKPHGYLAVVCVKLVLHPALIWVVGTVLISVGVALDSFAFHVLILVAALPSASNVSLLSERFGADTGRIARIILVSTVCAFLSFSLAVKLLE